MTSDRPATGLRIARIRLLPVTLAVAAMVLPFKIAAVWEGFTAADMAPVMVGAEASESKPATKAGEAKPAEAKAGETKSTESKPGGEADAKAGAKTPPGQPDAKPSALSGLLPGDRNPLTRTEIELLQQLQARREALDARERELDMREGLLRAAEQTLEAKTAELVQLQSKIETAVAKPAPTPEKPEQNVDGLVSIYEKMKPKDAARIFNELDMELLTAVLGGMKEAKTAPILAEMDATKARDVTARLALRQVAKAAP